MRKADVRAQPHENQTPIFTYPDDQKITELFAELEDAIGEASLYSEPALSHELYAMGQTIIDLRTPLLKVGAERRKGKLDADLQSTNDAVGNYLYNLYKRWWHVQSLMRKEIGV